MDIKEIQNLIKFVARAGVTEVAIEEGEFKITIKTDSASEHYVVQQAPQVVHAAPQVVAQATEQAAPVAKEAPKSDAPVEASKGNLVEIKSPMIGTFYRKSAPEKPAFVNVGDEIKAGDVLCIVEAMKLFNEIESEISGKIVKVLVEDNSPIEYDQPLFLVEPA
ncbi:MAG: acetyl-CoA carboxylase biotin carboxyl carrier protein [Crocinitomicaceae bacterium]|nr:acetyl-CoA carboxylase biotin carboxyl carrier protein [Crocinitomicaceae bacterium]